MFVASHTRARRAPWSKLLGAVALAALSSCDGATPAPSDVPGRVHLALTLGDGETVTSLTYTVLSPTGTTLAMGTIGVLPDSTGASSEVGSPVGTGDRIRLSGFASDGSPCAGTSAPFDVVAGEATPISVTLVCGQIASGADSGSVQIDATIVGAGGCPALAAWSVAPVDDIVDFPGGVVPFSVVSSTPDPGPLTYLWTASAGTFTDPTSPTASYLCAKTGTETLTLTVTGRPANPCSAAGSIQVDCISLCGNGVLDPGEQCEPPVPGMCDAACNLVPH